MALTKLYQQLRRDLKEAVAALNNAAQDLFRAAKTFAEPELLAAMEKIGKLHECMDRLERYAEEVKAGVITRGRINVEPNI